MWGVLRLAPTLQRGNAVKPLQRFVCARVRGTLERLDVLPRWSGGASAGAKLELLTSNNAAIIAAFMDGLAGKG